MSEATSATSRMSPLLARMRGLFRDDAHNVEPASAKSTDEPEIEKLHGRSRAISLTKSELEKEDWTLVFATISRELPSGKGHHLMHEFDMNISPTRCVYGEHNRMFVKTQEEIEGWFFGLKRAKVFQHNCSLRLHNDATYRVGVEQRHGDESIFTLTDVSIGGDKCKLVANKLDESSESEDLSDIEQKVYNGSWRVPSHFMATGSGERLIVPVTFHLTLSRSAATRLRAAESLATNRRAHLEVLNIRSAVDAMDV
jgi:hypothetical protein